MGLYSKYPRTLDLLRGLPEQLERDSLILLIVDGLGRNSLKINGMTRQTYETVFPSSTPVFFYSLASLKEPCEHGFLEWYARLENTVVTVPAWETIDGFTFSVGDLPKRKVFPFKSFTEIFHRKGFTTTIYTPFPDSLFTHYLAGKANIRGISYLSEVFPLSDSDLHVIYWPSVDSILHKHGYGPALDAEIQQVSTFVAGLQKTGVPLIILSDHGLIELKRMYTLPVIEETFPVGGSRVAFYNLDPETVKKHIRIPAGVFHIKDLPGYEKPCRRCLRMYGETVVIARDHYGFKFPFDPWKLAAGHGGLSDRELLVSVWKTRA